MSDAQHFEASPEMRHAVYDWTQQQLAEDLLSIESQVASRDTNLWKAASYTAITALGMHFFGDVQSTIDTILPHVHIHPEASRTSLGIWMALAPTSAMSIRHASHAILDQLELYKTKRDADLTCGMADGITTPTHLE